MIELNFFEVLEISNIKISFESYYFNKYVHSERDINQKILRHVDGAVKIYLKAHYEQRQHSSLPNHDSYKKIKLWRIDGDIDIKVWIELISLFFKGNEMILEYFNPVEFEKRFDLRIRDFKTWKSQQTDII
ncbi:hypothetical protein [Chroococcus sp. FPU101]|uniref:hypothetical protein n=1 Tax=Chroococcus sp. FPU101 TaxID=1974212 RepID=UPI001A8D9394|nr:hypothetical protein [Chroococcus sp. FPU101]GFE72035.1 hypothetical protein CFPU101_46450 [Chroococcus sp. FPU101]